MSHNMYPSTSRGAESDYDGATAIDGPTYLRPLPVPKHSSESKGKSSEPTINEAEYEDLPFVDNSIQFDQER
jgi:hypothetical protein